MSSTTLNKTARTVFASAANTASILMVLELKHLAAQLPGQRYVRAGTLLR